MLCAQRHGTFFFFLYHKSSAVKQVPKLITRIININQQGLNKSRQQGWCYVETMWSPICRQFRGQTCQNTRPATQLPYSRPSKQGHALSYFNGGNKRQIYILKLRLCYILNVPDTFREEKQNNTFLILCWQFGQICRQNAELQLLTYLL